jgi:hypothetical protein
VDDFLFESGSSEQMMLSYMSERINNLTTGSSDGSYEPINFAFVSHSGDFIATASMVKLLQYLKIFFNAVKLSFKSQLFYAAHTSFVQCYFSDSQLYTEISNASFHDSLFHSPLNSIFLNSTVFDHSSGINLAPESATVTVEQTLQSLCSATSYVEDSFAQIEIAQALYSSPRGKIWFLGPRGAIPSSPCII